MSLFYIGGWIPTLDVLPIDKSDFQARTYEVGDGIPSHELRVSLAKKGGLNNGLLSEGKIEALIRGKCFPLLKINNLLILKNGVWIASVEFEDSAFAQSKNSRYPVYLKLYQYLKDHFHKHIFHDEEQDAILKVYEGQEWPSKSQVLSFVVANYCKKFESYIELISAKLQDADRFFEEGKYAQLKRSHEFMFKLLSKFRGELSFYRALLNVYNDSMYREPNVYSEALGVFERKVLSPVEFKGFILTGVGVILSAVGLFIGIVGLLIGLGCLF